MASHTHPIYGDLVCQREFDFSRNWFLVDGGAPLATVEWYVDDGATAKEILDRMTPWHRGTTSVEAVEKIVVARQAFWDRQRR